MLGMSIHSEPSQASCPGIQVHSDQAAPALISQKLYCLCEQVKAVDSAAVFDFAQPPSEPETLPEQRIFAFF